MRLGASTAEAIAQVLDTLFGGAVERGEVSVLADGATPFANLPRGAVAASVSYANGASGAHIFVLTPAGARALAGAMGVPAPSVEADGEATVLELSEPERSAVAEAATQMMAAAASAIGVVLGQEVQISPPDIRVIDDPESAVEAWGTAPHATSTTFSIGGEPCRLIQLVPSPFVVRVARAFDELSVGDTGAGPGRQPAIPGGNGDPRADSVGLGEALTDIKLRVWAELGRTRLPLGRALTLPLGAVLDLDRAAEAPVDLFVNGLRFGQGDLLVTDDGEWAIRLTELAAQPKRKERRRTPDELPRAMPDSRLGHPGR